jgi:hypothetical protein
MPSTARWPGTCPERSRRSGWPILVASFATRVGPSICAMPSRNNSPIPTGAQRSGGTLCFRTAAKTIILFKQAQASILHQWTVAETVLPRNRKICHPERSNCFAQRSGCGVEGPLPAQIGRRPSGNSPMLAPTNSLRQSTSRLVFVPGMTGDLRQPRFLLGSEMDFHACQSRRPGAPLLPIHREGWALGPQL